MACSCLSLKLIICKHLDYILKWPLNFKYFNGTQPNGIDGWFLNTTDSYSTSACLLFSFMVRKLK